MWVLSKICIMNLSDAGIEAFILMIYCAIGMSQEIKTPFVALTMMYNLSEMKARQVTIDTIPFNHSLSQ